MRALRLLSALAACRLGAAALAKIAWQRRLAAEGSEGLELQLALPEEELRVKLWRNTALLAENARHVLHYKDGTQEEGPGLQEHCFFLGQVEGHPGSSASFSACEGRLSGLVLRGNRTLWIDPAEGSAGFGGGEGGRRLRGEALHEVRSLEGDALDMVRDVMRFVTRKAAPSEPSGRRLASTTKYVEVLAVNDFSRFTAFGGQASLSALAAHTVSVLNTVTAIFRASPTDGVSFPHSVQVVLTGQHTFLESDPWDQTVKMQGAEVSEDSLLEAFLTWSAAEMASGTISENDNRLLLSGRDFVASTVGYAPMSSMCDLARSGSINMCGPSSTDVAGCAATVAHEMGHNFGMSHDSGSCPQSGLVMAAVGTSDAADQFSSCSVSDITTFFTKVYDRNGQCLENKPSKVFGDPVCGNGFREEGEDCDCGSSDCSSLDTCCNGATCRFADPSYECSDATGACCESCKNVTAAAQKVCRAARSSCDLAEICAGGTSQCPKDEYVYPGASCSLAEAGQSYAGLCSLGSCHSMAYTCAVDVTRDFAGTWDLSPACAGFNDDCATVVCHDATSSSPAQCGQYFSVHGIHMPVPDGTPCWHPSEPLGLRSGMCFQGQCRQPGSLAVVGLCGNGGIDYGEECDCGASGAGDPCCDCASCTLKSSSACAGTDPCCDSSTCSLKAEGWLPPLGFFGRMGASFLVIRPNWMGPSCHQSVLNHFPAPVVPVSRFSNMTPKLLAAVLQVCN
ncbi:unnamed protein product [Effrenium voratum]|uniref:Uncharacterized protein n=1 Tax=Effrenium voratum TaxID=2562239 RepID=A0AA36JM91_9DINO|nr:unnamed protein product [Effrenium voratum]